MTEDSFASQPSFILEHIPKENEVQYAVGPYQILSEIGKGGMGEVLLAYDTKCGRRIALKKIRADLVKHKQMHNRFLKEARITSQLTHPSIIPIYTIQDLKDKVYYTMPFVQGETLKKILKTTREQEKKGEPLHHIGGSIPALIRIFINVCQAIAYAHSKGVLHRDVKPENVMIGEYGEVIILDWGLAKLIHGSENEEEIPESLSQDEMTRIGKVVGTVSYMAPERGRGNPATIQTEIYALGVILYQILTLHPPFARPSLEEFRKLMDKEKLRDPIEVAPYRDVPRLLSRICMKCLEKDPKERYQTVDELLHELENYIEGRSEWFQIAKLNVDNKEDWEFQEHILMAEHIAITRGPEVSEWVSLMISKGSYTGNTKIEARVKIGENGHGIGFLLSIPEAAERTHLNDGYCLWIGSDINQSTKLLRSTVEVLHAPEIYLERDRWYTLRIEKIDHNLHFYLDDDLKASYISHLPLVGTHIGLLTRDADFILEDFNVYVGSQNITVNCLAVPDAFLAHKDYATALNEYRRIGYSFPGRAEGREALFRAGITLLEHARSTKDPKKRETLFEQALEEFEKLHSTPGAPLQYLGKAHVYRAMHDYDEEIKCFELAFRRYPNHPLLPILQEQVLYRMHESSHFHRKSAYNFILTAVRHLPRTTITTNAQKLFASLKTHWEPLPFILDDPSSQENQQVAIQLTFWLAKPYILIEIIDELFQGEEIPFITLSNALFSLVELQEYDLAQHKLEDLVTKHQKVEEFDLIKCAIQAHTESVSKAWEHFFQKKKKKFSPREMRLILHLMETALDQQETDIVHTIASKVGDQDRLRVDCYRIWAHLLDKEWNQAGEIIQSYPIDTLTSEATLLHTLYGCWLTATEGKQIAEIHFSGVLEVTYPRTCILLSHYLNGSIAEETPWHDHAFQWEEQQLRRQLTLYQSL